MTVQELIIKLVNVDPMDEVMLYDKTTQKWAHLNENPKYIEGESAIGLIGEFE